jgi:hypothetical protein
MFKANWFLNGEAYMTETNSYWKTKYPKPKEGYMQTNGMPGNPVNIAGAQNGQRVACKVRPTEKN